MVGLDRFQQSQTFEQRRNKFSKEEISQVKQWIDKKVYERPDDPSQVLQNTSLGEYLKPADYPGSCVLSTLTNSIGCIQWTTMKQLVHIIAFASKESPAQAQLQFQQDLSVRYKFEGGILVQFLNGEFHWLKPSEVEHLDADYITWMDDNNVTLAEVYTNLEKRTGVSNFMQVASY